MRRVSRATIAAWTIAFALLSCTRPCPSDRDQQFRDMLPELRFNGQVSILVTSNAYPEVELLVRNESDDYLVFGPGLGVRAFIFDEKDCDWHEIENNYSFYPNTEQALGPVGDPLHNSYMTYFAPENPQAFDSQEYRILIYGSIYQDGIITNDMTATYLDVSK